MTKEQKFYKALQGIFIGAKIEGTGGFINLMLIKSKYYEKIDIAETLSNLTGKWIKQIKDGEVVFEVGSAVNTKDLDYKLIKPLIWWE